VQSADTGAPIGTDNVRLPLTLEQDVRALTGSFKAQLKSTDGTVLLAVRENYSSTPITV
jgi:hypothetical protein